VTAEPATQSTRRERVRVERGAKRVRAYVGGVIVADTVRPLLVWEKPYYPTYYVPAADVRIELFAPDGGIDHSPSRGDGTTLTLRAAGREVAGAAVRYDESPFEELRGTIRLRWDAMDAWYEEDEEVYTHPRDPYTRLDILASSRHVRVEVDGTTVAESRRPTLLFETGLPTRWYLPRTDVRMDLLVPSDTVTHCPYKGQAEHWSLRVGETIRRDLAWSYRTPLPESQKIGGLVAFYDEKVDVYVDEVLQERPRTKFA
jgi:uncharacterized protein (DUF427 family)